MARITDPDKLVKSTNDSNNTPDGNVYFDTTNKTIELIDNDVWTDAANELLDKGSVSGDDGGVDLQALYSFIKETWKSDSTLIKFPFPMIAITAEQYEFIEGWRLTNSSDSGLEDSIPLIRNGGWSEIAAGATTPTNSYMGVVTLGNINSNHRVYYSFNSATKVDFSYDGPVNEPVKIFTDGGDDFRDVADTFAVFIRSAPEDIGGGVINGYTYDKSDKTAIGVSALTNQVFRFPLAEAVDPDLVTLDTSINSGGSGLPDTAPYNDIDIDYYQLTQQINIGGTNRDFGVIIDANDDDADSNATKAQIYTTIQYLLRQSVDIKGADSTETDAKIGNISDVLLRFVGPNLKTIAQTTANAPSGGVGVAIEDYVAGEVNNLQFIDNTGTERAFPFKEIVTLSFNNNVIEDANANFFLFYNTNSSGNFGSSNAQLVQADGSSGDIGSGDVTGPVHYKTPIGLTGATSGSSATVASAGGVVLSAVSGYAVDELIGKVLRISAPAALVGSYFITDNDATTITVSSDDPFEEAASTTVSYTIVDKNTTGLRSFSYDYDNNVDGGRTAATNDDVVFITLGLNTAQYVSTVIADGIERVANKTLSITSSLERNYNDPVNS